MKAALTVLILSLVSIPCSGQVLILSEDFEGTNPPVGWTRSQNTPSVGWVFGSDLGSQYFSIPSHGTYAASNDDANDDNSATLNLADQDRLITPVLDLTPYASTGVVLEFEYFLPGTYGSVGTVEVTTDGGSTWLVVGTMAPMQQWISTIIDLSAHTSSSTVQLAFRHNDGGQWADGFAVDDITVTSVVALDVSVDELTMDEYLAQGVASISARITNQGASVITAVSAVYQVDSGSVVPGPIGGLSLGLGQSMEIVHPVPFNFGTTGESTVTFTVSAVNGSADENPSDNTAIGSVSVLSHIPEKYPVLEVHTGAWAQFAPDGTAVMEDVLATVPNAIAVTVHSTDDMEIPDGTVISGTYIGGYPSGTIDRYKFEDQSEVEVNRGIWMAKTMERESHVVPVEVSLPVIAYDPVTRTVDVEVQAEFVGTVNADLRLNCWIVEDGVVGSGSGYDQANFYNTQVGHPFFGAGDPIVGFEHDRVVRSMLGGPWGTAGEIPGTVVAGDVFSTTYSHVLPGDQDEKRMTLIGIVSRYEVDTNERHILNAFELPLAIPIFGDGFESGDTLEWTTS